MRLANDLIKQFYRQNIQNFSNTFSAGPMNFDILSNVKIQCYKTGMVNLKHIVLKTFIFEEFDIFEALS